MYEYKSQESKQLHQEAFNKVKEHLLKQGVKSVYSLSGLCLYRGPNNTKCAIGCLIPDEEYNEEYDTQTNEKGFLSNGEQWTLSRISERVSTLKVLDIPLLRKLQRIHDEEEIENWAVFLKNFALEYDLNPGE